VENPERPHLDEDFAQVLAALKDQYQVTESKVAKRIGVHVSTVNNWAHGKANPRAAAIRALAAEFPAFTEERLFAATGRKAPGPLSPDSEAELIEYFRELTEERQRIMLIQAKALRDDDRQS
jgi:transcriptional regulator with XRE-family HTH domain